MKTMTFTEFRRNATACITAVEKGETIRVLRHGNPVADIVPISDDEQPASWNRPALRLTVKGASLAREILEEREYTAR